MAYNLIDDYQYQYKNMVSLLVYCGLDPNLIDDYSLEDVLNASKLVNFTELGQSNDLTELELNIVSEYNLKEASIKRSYYYYTLLKAMVENA